MFSVKAAVRMLDEYARENCRACERARGCVLSGSIDASCRHGQALLEVREFYKHITNRFQELEARFLIEISKVALDGTRLLFDSGDVFTLKGEFSSSQLLCKEKSPGGKEFTVTKQTEGAVWERIL